MFVLLERLLILLNCHQVAESSFWFSCEVYIYAFEDVLSASAHEVLVNFLSADRNGEPHVLEVQLF